MEKLIEQRLNKELLEILKGTKNNKNRVKALLKSYTEPSLYFLLEEEDVLFQVILKYLESNLLKSQVLCKTLVNGILIDELRKRKRLKRNFQLVELTDKEKEMFIDSEDPIETLEQYDHIKKTYGQNIADFALGKIDFKELQELEGCSQRTLYRRLEKIKEAEQNV